MAGKASSVILMLKYRVMEFDEFQTETGTLKKMQTDYTGDVTVADSFMVTCYFEFGSKRVAGPDGVEVTARGMVFVDPHPSFDRSHRNWNFTFEGIDYDVISYDRIKDIGNNEISHYELGVI